MARVQVAVGVIENSEGQILIAQRKKGVHQEGKWEFPGGKLEGGESVELALARELKEELNITIECFTPLIELSFDYPEIEVRLYVSFVDSYSGEAVGREAQLIKWVDKANLKDYQFPEANKVVLKAIELGREYAIINSSDISEVLAQLNNIASQGVKLVQIRAKDLSRQLAKSFFNQLNKECTRLGVSYLLNSGGVRCSDNVGGIHLTSAELMALDCKPESSGYIAASCHNLDELKRAERLGLDFAVLSSIKETQSHPSIKLLGWQQFEHLVAQVNIPVYALGGLNKSDFNQLVALGAQGISGISLFK